MKGPGEGWNLGHLCSLMLCLLQFYMGLLLCSELSMMTRWKDPALPWSSSQLVKMATSHPGQWDAGIVCVPKRDVPQAGGPRAGRRALQRGQLFGGADTLQNLQEGEGLALNERKEEGRHCRQRGDPQRFGKCHPHNVWWRLPSSSGFQECCLLLPSCSVCAGQTREQDRCKILHLASKLTLLWGKPWGSLSRSPVLNWE